LPRYENAPGKDLLSVESRRNKRTGEMLKVVLDIIRDGLFYMQMTEILHVPFQILLSSLVLQRTGGKTHSRFVLMGLI
jgi:hypothetical protein